MKAVAFSDTHTLFPKVPAAKYMFYAGDFESGYNTPEESRAIAVLFLNWYRKQQGQFKFLVPGNHDFHFWNDPEDFRKICKENNIFLLDNETVEADGLRVFGSPYFYTCRANSNLRLDFPDPDSFDVLLTHVPPKGILDFAQGKMENIGSQPLRDYVQERKPKLHFFGHCHEGFSSLTSPFYNVALRSRNNKKVLINQPVSLEISHVMEKK